MRSHAHNLSPQEHEHATHCQGPPAPVAQRARCPVHPRWPALSDKRGGGGSAQHIPVGLH